MNKIFKFLAAALTVTCLLMTVTACEKKEEDLGDKIHDAADDAGDAVEDATDDLGDAMEDAGDEMEDTMEDATDSLDGGGGA